MFDACTIRELGLSSPVCVWAPPPGVCPITPYQLPLFLEGECCEAVPVFPPCPVSVPGCSCEAISHACLRTDLGQSILGLAPSGLRVLMHVYCIPVMCTMRVWWKDGIPYAKMAYHKCACSTYLPLRTWHDMPTCVDIFIRP